MESFHDLPDGFVEDMDLRIRLREMGVTSNPPPEHYERDRPITGNARHLGPDEGATRPNVHHADPMLDDEALDWYERHPRWWTGMVQGEPEKEEYYEEHELYDDRGKFWKFDPISPDAPSGAHRAIQRRIEFDACDVYYKKFLTKARTVGANKTNAVCVGCRRGFVKVLPPEKYCDCCRSFNVPKSRYEWTERRRESKRDYIRGKRSTNDDD